MSQITKSKRVIALVTVIIVLIGIALLISRLVYVRSSCQHGFQKEFVSQNFSYMCSLFDELDSKVNKGKGYSEYLNTDGFPTGALLAWSESYLMQAYANMYRATGDVKYMHQLNEHIKRVLANRDDKIGQKDYKGDLVPCWGTDRYTRNKAWMHFIAHTGMITYPMLEFVCLVREMDIEEYLITADSIIEQVEESVKYHDKDWKGSYYVYPQDFYKKNYTVAINQMATLGRSLILLYNLTGKEEYGHKSRALARFIKVKSVKQNDTAGYMLRDHFLPGNIAPEEVIVDISHANHTIHFAYMAYKSDIVFDEDDMHRFTKTIKNLAQGNDNHFPKFLDGTGNFDYEVTAEQYAFLAEFDKEVYDSIIDLFFNHLKIDQTAKYMQEDWWGTVMLSLSRLILYQGNIE